MNRVQRIAATLGVPAVVLASMVFVAAQSPAEGTPNVETVLPADGVLSIERSGNEWTVMTESAPGEVKVMETDLGPVCGINYADTLGLCTTTTTFTLDAPCVYVQVDGIVGHNSSDPFACRPGGTPSTSTPSPSETPTSTPTPTSSETPLPSSSPTPLPSASTPPPAAGTDTPSATSPLSKGQRTTSAPAQLAATGMPKWLGLLVLILVPSLVALGVWMISRSKTWRLQAPETEAEMTERYWRQGHEDHV